MTNKIQKFIRSLDKKTKELIKTRIAELKKSPFEKNQDIKKLKTNGENIYRLRVGEIRIIFEIVEGEIIVHDIDYRSNIY